MLKFLLSYKLSQDQIELLFGKVRPVEECKNNPTVRQFPVGFKKLLVHDDMLDITSGVLVGSPGICTNTNCSPNYVTQHSVKIMNTFSEKQCQKQKKP